MASPTCTVVDQQILAKICWIDRLRATMEPKIPWFHLQLWWDVDASCCECRKDSTFMAWWNLAWTWYGVPHALCRCFLRRFQDQEYPAEHPVKTIELGTFAKHHSHTLGSHWFQAWNRCFHTSNFQGRSSAIVGGSVQGRLCCRRASGRLRRAREPTSWWLSWRERSGTSVATTFFAVTCSQAWWSFSWWWGL